MTRASLLALTCTLLACPDPEPAPDADPPDYSMPGDNGGMVGGEPVRGAEHHTDRVPPAMGECGVTYTALATVRQQVPVCSPSFAFGPFYDRAKVEAQYFAGLLECPEQCTPPVTWISHHRWGCLDITDPAIASASVEASVSCPLEPVPVEDLPRPSDAELTGQDGVAGQPTQEPGLIEEVGGNIEVSGCPATELTIYEYHTPVTSCDGVNYQAHVTTADTMARQFHGSIACPSGCVRSQYMSGRTEWSCEDQNGQPTVVVNVLFDVRCTPG